ncbi:MAG: DUF1295 domain-containing protein [Spongiibacteraceae bacterium]
MPRADATGPALLALAALALLGVLLWLVSLRKQDVSIIDSAWSLFQLIAALIYFANLPAVAARATLVLALVAVWSLRLAGYITWRNWGHPEDHRYRAMRARNQPHFEWKSLYLVFGLQALLAWLLSVPSLIAMTDTAPLAWPDYAGALLFIVGFGFESIGDFQLARFKREAKNRHQVMATGLWRYTRHPNYFGEFCMAWGLYVIACATGGWWTVFAPLLITFLLLKVSGVALLEKDIGERRPAYRDYIATTNAFFPGWPRQTETHRQR